MNEEDANGSDAKGLIRNSLSERIYARLRVALMTGVYESGAKLNIRGLAAQYQISPTPVREAVMQLVRESSPQDFGWVISRACLC